jgi:hypothetical protein
MRITLYDDGTVTVIDQISSEISKFLHFSSQCHSIFLTVYFSPFCQLIKEAVNSISKNEKLSYEHLL